ncbi:glycosyltransferase family 4 protein [Streptomyces microflavus]
MTRPLRIVARVHAMPPHHNAGAEHMLTAMLRPLVERGHDVSVWLSRYQSGVLKEYEYDGVRVVPLGARLDFGSAVRHSSLVISHLESVPSTAALARGYGKPFAVICHNTFRETFANMAAGGTALAVYNSQWMQAEADLYFADRRTALRPPASMIVRPPVAAKEYAAKKRGDRVTLVNCSRGKGGDTLRALAASMPDTPFLAVEGGYDEQVTFDEFPNVEVVQHMDGHEMRDNVYARTRILVMPSRYESWGRAGVEALASGIPVIAHPTPGLCESLAAGGIFVDRSDVAGYEATIRRLGEPGEYRLASKRAKERSAELNPAGDLTAWCDTVEGVCCA